MQPYHFQYSNSYDVPRFCMNIMEAGSWILCLICNIIFMIVLYQTKSMHRNLRLLLANVAFVYCVVGMSRFVILYHLLNGRGVSDEWLFIYIYPVITVPLIMFQVVGPVIFLPLPVVFDIFAWTFTIFLLKRNMTTYCHDSQSAEPTHLSKRYQTVENIRSLRMIIWFLLYSIICNAITVSLYAVFVFYINENELLGLPKSWFSSLQIFELRTVVGNSLITDNTLSNHFAILKKTWASVNPEYGPNKYKPSDGELPPIRLSSLTRVGHSATA
uniref:G protein-coupled receptor n=1 Tax=Panagrellus redivivus TaxID=6233 RepID=A0A7E4VWV8_PANRE